MDTKTFLNNFGYIADAPNGVNKLRELIFDLAAKGSLIDSESDQFSKLGDICEFVMGQAPPGSECNKEGVGTIFVKTGEFGTLYPEVREWTTKPLKMAREGDVLVCVVGATIGKLNLAIDCAIGRSVASIRPNTKITTKYLYFMLMPYVLRLRAQSRGSAQGTITKSELSTVEIRVPTIEEQKRIVAKVDQLMALCDQLETQQQQKAQTRVRLNNAALDKLLTASDPDELNRHWQRIANNFYHLYGNLENIEKLRAGILQLATRGLLVEQDQNDEPATELLKNMENTKAKLVENGFTRKGKPPRKIGDQEPPYNIPDSWKWIRLGAAGLCFTGKTPSTKNPEYFDGPIPFIGPGEITVNGKVLNSTKSLTNDGSEFSVMSKPGDILMVCIGGSIGKSAIVTSEVAFNQQINSIRPIMVDSSFLNYSMNTLHFQSSILAAATGSATPIINRSKWEELLIPLPPFEEQKCIVAKVDQLMALCDQLETKLRQAQSINEKLVEATVRSVAAA